MVTVALAIRAKKEEGVSLRAKEHYSNIKIKKILSLAVKWSKLDDL